MDILSYVISFVHRTRIYRNLTGVKPTLDVCFHVKVKDQVLGRIGQVSGRVVPKVLGQDVVDVGREVLGNFL